MARRTNKTKAVLENIIGTAEQQTVESEVKATGRSFATTEEEAAATTEKKAAASPSKTKAAPAKEIPVTGKPSDEEVSKFLAKLGDKAPKCDPEDARQTEIIRTAVAVTLSSKEISLALSRIVAYGEGEFWLDHENLMEGSAEFTEIQQAAYHFEGGTAGGIVTWGTPNRFLSNLLWGCFHGQKSEEAYQEFYDALADFDTEATGEAKGFYDYCMSIIPAIRDELVHYRKTPILLGNMEPESVESAEVFHAEIMKSLAAYTVAMKFYNDVYAIHGEILSTKPEEEPEPVVQESQPHGKAAVPSTSSKEAPKPFAHIKGTTVSFEDMAPVTSPPTRPQKISVDEIVRPMDIEAVLGGKDILSRYECEVQRGEVTPRFVVRVMLLHTGNIAKYTSAKEMLADVFRGKGYTPEDLTKAVLRKYSWKYPSLIMLAREFMSGKYDDVFTKDIARVASEKKDPTPSSATSRIDAPQPSWDREISFVEPMRTVLRAFGVR